MRKITIALASTLGFIALLSATTASAQESGVYVRGALGASVQGEVSAQGQAANTARGSAKTESAVSGDLAAGYDFGNGLRLEGAYSRLNSDLKRSGSLSGKGSALDAFMVNGYYDFNREGQFQPYLGAGIGLANVDAGGLRVGNPSLLLSGDKQVAAWQLMGGVGYRLNDNLVIDGGVRVLRTDDAKVRVGGNNYEVQREATTVQIGARYRF